MSLESHFTWLFGRDWAPSKGFTLLTGNTVKRRSFHEKDVVNKVFHLPWLI